MALIISDLLSLLFCFGSAYFLRTAALPHLSSKFRLRLPSLGPFLEHDYLLAAAILVASFFLAKLYSRRMSFWEEFRHLFQALCLTFILMAALIYIERNYQLYSRAVLFLSWLFSLAVFPWSRYAVKRLLVKMRLWNKRVLILGIGPQARQVALSLKSNPMLGYELAGFVSESRAPVNREIVPRGRVLGPISRLESLSRAQNARDIILALPGLSPEKLELLMRRSERLTETIRIIPDFGRLVMVGVEADTWGNVLSLAVPRNLAKPWNILLKRSMESVAALVLFILLAPFYLAICLAIKLDSPGPVIYRQKRLGRKSKVFSMLKFRSMVVNNKPLLHRLLKNNRAAEKDWSRYQKVRHHDPRVTRVGRFLRKYSLDELPQLINVLRGEMNLVGPRPYLPREKKRIGGSLPIISQVKPGLTGLWQVSGRNRLSFTDRLAWDEYYIRNWSLWLDASIFLRTLKVMARGDGAY